MTLKTTPSFEGRAFHAAAPRWSVPEIKLCLSVSRFLGLVLAPHYNADSFASAFNQVELIVDAPSLFASKAVTRL